MYTGFSNEKEEAVAASDSIDIIVEGGYTPSVIAVLQGKPITINFLRKDPSNCLEEVMVPEFKVRKFLPLNETVSINITPKQKANLPFLAA